MMEALSDVAMMGVSSQFLSWMLRESKSLLLVPLEFEFEV